MRRMAMGVVRMRQMATEDCERQEWAGAGPFLWDRGQKGAILPETKDKLRNIGSPHFLSQDPLLSGRHHGFQSRLLGSNFSWCSTFQAEWPSASYLTSLCSSCLIYKVGCCQE